ncbi:MAG: hypothetical protein M3370_07120 [Actinomycetota bacterium]|nr:hypothetical protein [Actinomycetota bacterium]
MLEWPLHAERPESHLGLEAVVCTLGQLKVVGRGFDEAVLGEARDQVSIGLVQGLPAAVAEATERDASQHRDLGRAEWVAGAAKLCDVGGVQMVAAGDQLNLPVVAAKRLTGVEEAVFDLVERRRDGVDRLVHGSGQLVRGVRSAGVSEQRLQTEDELVIGCLRGAVLDEGVEVDGQRGGQALRCVEGQRLGLLSAFEFDDEVPSQAGLASQIVARQRELEAAARDQATVHAAISHPVWSSAVMVT